MLQTLLYELDGSAFSKMLDTFLSKLIDDEETLSFYEYFHKQYVVNERYKLRAYCFRINVGINTNMSIENFNRVLKYCYLRRKRLND